jgi:hypothetical protein
MVRRVVRGAAHPALDRVCLRAPMEPTSSSERVPLVPHPATPGHAVRELTVVVDRPASTELTLTYRLSGELQDLRIPEPRAPQRADGLWRHTCFEAFVGDSEGPTYWEYNFSPSGAWAAYQFTSYREGMHALLEGAAPLTTLRTTADSMEMKVVVDLSWHVRAAASRLRLGVTAVIETRERGLSYWALKHPAAKPDFHHADSFVLPLG